MRDCKLLKTKKENKIKLWENVGKKISIFATKKCSFTFKMSKESEQFPRKNKCKYFYCVSDQYHA